MRLLVINPNTSEAMTEDIRKTVDRVKSADTEAVVVHPDFGPEALESFYDYQLAAFGMLRFRRRHPEACDGVLVACYGDPGLYAIKETENCPVVGIAEGSMAAATLIGARFAILTASDKAVPMMENMVDQYGMRARCAGVYALHTSVLDAEKNREQTIRQLIETGKEARDHGAEVLIPGCAGMTGLSGEVEDQLAMTVLDPVGISFGLLETLARQRIRLSRSGLYAAPAPKKTANRDLLEK
jgi:allantoin racemase